VCEGRSCCTPTTPAQPAQPHPPQAFKNKIDAKNNLENYAYNLRNTMNDAAVSGKLDASDKDKINSEVDTTIAWLDANQQAEVDEYGHKLKELEGLVNPIMTKMYGAGGAPSGMGGMPSGGAAPTADGGAGPTIEEVD